MDVGRLFSHRGAERRPLPCSFTYLDPRPRTLDSLLVTVLSDRSIKQSPPGRLVIEPLDEDAIQPASVDLRLDRTFRIFRITARPFVDVHEDMDDLTVNSSRSTPSSRSSSTPAPSVSARPWRPSPCLTISSPGSMVSPRSADSVPRPRHRWLRRPWPTGKLTLELSNQSQMPVALYYGMRIAQISFLSLSTPVDRPHASPSSAANTRGQTGPTPPASPANSSAANPQLEPIHSSSTSVSAAPGFVILNGAKCSE